MIGAHIPLESVDAIIAVPNFILGCLYLCTRRSAISAADKAAGAERAAYLALIIILLLTKFRHFNLKACRVLLSRLLVLDVDARLRLKRFSLPQLRILEGLLERALALGSSLDHFDGHSLHVLRMLAFHAGDVRLQGGDARLK